MAPRKKLGIPLIYDESWVGGMYYVFNIINALNFLPEEKKPELVIFYRSDSIKEKLKGLTYPFITTLPLKKSPALAERILMKIQKLLSGRISYRPQYAKGTIDFIFPCDAHVQGFLYCLKRIRTIYWIPDFQHKYLPHFFDTREIESRDNSFAKIAMGRNQLVLSSEESKRDFLKFYPEHNAEIFVISFATVLPPYEHIRMEDLRVKYGITKPYFISPNQFWAHKNHIVLLKAVALLKKKGYNYQVFFTGKEHDYRNPDYVTGLKKYIAENQIEEYIHFLGFIDRADQLQLMNHAIAVVQPSLFEGWSTVVEDSKAMDQTLILSSLKVHKEQCGEKAIYFEPTNEQELADILEKCLVEKIRFPTNAYHNKILKYADQIMNL